MADGKSKSNTRVDRPERQSVMNPGGQMVTAPMIPPGLARLAALQAAMAASGNFAPKPVAGAFSAPGFGRQAAYMQGGNRLGSQVPLKANGIPNVLAAGFGQ